MKLATELIPVLDPVQLPLHEATSLEDFQNSEQQICLVVFFFFFSPLNTTRPRAKTLIRKRWCLLTSLCKLWSTFLRSSGFTGWFTHTALCPAPGTHALVTFEFYIFKLSLNLPNAVATETSNFQFSDSVIVKREPVCVDSRRQKVCLLLCASTYLWDRAEGPVRVPGCCRTSCSKMQLGAETIIHANWYKLGQFYPSSLAS